MTAQAIMIGDLNVNEMTRINYTPQKGNILDVYLSKFLAKFPSLITVKKLNFNWYTFNDKTKVLIKLENNNKLVVRVGVGFSCLEKYLD